MAGISFPIKRPVGRALVVGTVSSRPQPLASIQALGFTCAEVDDPYAAAAELCRRPLVYRAVVLSLTSLYKEELALIAMLKRKLPHVDIWLTHLDGRQAALAEAMRLGADGLLGEDGALHRMTPAQPTDPASSPASDDAASLPAESAETVVHASDSDFTGGEPVLSADELRALLQEQPIFPPEGES